MRVDQKHYKRKTILHTLADNGDARTMDLFLGISYSSLGALNPADVDDTGYTPMMYLESRNNAEELREPFQRVLELVESARRSCGDFTIDTNPLKEKSEIDEDDDIFMDAVETL
jgi:hypothetical protein